MSVRTKEGFVVLQTVSTHKEITTVPVAIREGSLMPKPGLAKVLDLAQGRMTSK